MAGGKFHRLPKAGRNQDRLPLFLKSGNAPAGLSLGSIVFVAHMPLSAIISVTAALLALAAWRYRSTILRIRLAPTLFSGARQDWTFSHIAEIFPTVEIPAATRRTPFPEAASRVFRQVGGAFRKG